MSGKGCNCITGRNSWWKFFQQYFFWSQWWCCPGLKADQHFEAPQEIDNKHYFVWGGKNVFWRILIQTEEKHVSLCNHVMNLDAELSLKLKFLFRGISEIRSKWVKQHQIFPSNSQVCQGLSKIDYLTPVINAKKSITCVQTVQLILTSALWVGEHVTWN